jgi:hypothetical protein
MRRFSKCAEVDILMKVGVHPARSGLTAEDLPEILNI